MNATVICPSDRAAAAFFARQRPLALVPLLGRTLLDRAMTALAQRGIEQVSVLAADRPEQIRAALRNGKPWGVEAEVVPVAVEPSSQLDTITLDHWPSEPLMRLWDHPGQWLDILLAAMPEAGRDTLGMREVGPGIWISTKARVSPKAHLEAPCWIGRNASIGAGATIGPRSIIEEGACVDDGAEVIESFVGPSTYVGGHVELQSSLAWGKGLLNWRTSSFTEVSDVFLLADLSQRLRRRAGSSVLGRITALLGLGAALPLFVIAVLVCLLRGKPLFTVHRGVRAPVMDDPAYADTLVWHSLNGVPQMLRRLPELWNILHGESAWIGNRPLTRTQAAELTTDFDRLWLAVAPGLLSLADAHGCKDDPADDVVRAHAAFYAAHAGWREDMAVLSTWAQRVWHQSSVKHFLQAPAITHLKPAS